MPSCCVVRKGKDKGTFLCEECIEDWKDEMFEEYTKEV
jgi:hypothetical protein